jgi:ABC-type iron transport system FetAB permease component
MAQDDTDKVLHQHDHEAVMDERLDGITAENTAIATPAAPGATYVQAEHTAIRNALAAVLVALRNSKIIPNA